MAKYKLFVALCLLYVVVLPAWAAVRFHFIDVGHGDAILIEEEGRGIALVDAGMPEYGETVWHYLQDLGIQRIEQLYVTHTHQDHIGGIPTILENVDVGVIFHTGMMHDGEEAQRFADYLAKDLWPVKIVSDGDVTFEGDDLTIEVLHPTAGSALQQDVDANSNSMVLLVTFMGVKVLLPADINGDAELKLVERHGAMLKCQVMKASHHASRSSNQAELLEAVQPDIAVVTVGPNNWGYPDPSTIHRLRQNVPHLFRTDEDGTVIIETDGNTVKVIQPEGF